MGLYSVPTGKLHSLLVEPITTAIEYSKIIPLGLKKLKPAKTFICKLHAYIFSWRCFRVLQPLEWWTYQLFRSTEETSLHLSYPSHYSFVKQTNDLFGDQLVEQFWTLLVIWNLLKNFHNYWSFRTSRTNVLNSVFESFSCLLNSRRK